MHLNIRERLFNVCLTLWGVLDTIGRTLQRAYDAIVGLRAVYRSQRTRRRRMKSELSDLVRMARVPERPKVSLFFKWPGMFRLKWKARRKTVEQLKAMVERGERFPSVLRIADDEDKVRTPAGAESNPTSSGEQTLSERIAATQEVKGRTAKREGDTKKDAFETAQDLARKLVNPKPTSNKPSRINISREEALMADAMTDAMVRAPRGSEVQKIDTRVSGYWEKNPNANEKVQEAMQLPIVSGQVRTIIQHLISAGATIQGPAFMVERVRKWFDIEMELQTEHERGLDRFITDLAKQMLAYGGACLVRQRTLSTQLKPFKHPVTGKLTPPTWGYAIPDMSTIEAFIDDFSRPRRWRQNPSLYTSQDPKEYPARDVHFARIPTQNSSLYFWTPTFILPALYAINVLRELHSIMESHTEALIDIPYYVQVGDKDFLTGQVTQHMIDDTRDAINRTPRGGTLIVPWYAKISRVEVEDYLEQLIKAADFWGLEIRRGIGGSTLTDGQGDSATRNTSDALTERDMREAGALVPELQRAFRFLVWDKIFEWAEAGEFADEGIKNAEDLLKSITTAQDMAHLVFTEIDLAEQIRRETHALNKWLSGAIKHSELRKELGEIEDADLADQYWFQIQSELTIEQTKKAEEIKAQMNPSNQHGTQTKPKKRSNA